MLAHQRKEVHPDDTERSVINLSGTVWRVNAALLSTEYVSAMDWHGWDKVEVTITDLGYDGLLMAEPTTRSLHLLVAAVNDAPVIEVTSYESVRIVDKESSLTDEAPSAFLVPAAEDTVTVITEVSISDVDAEVAQSSLSRRDRFSGMIHADGDGVGLRNLAVMPRIEIMLSCTYGLVALGGEQEGLLTTNASIQAGEQRLTVVDTLSNINKAMSEGIVYTPAENWNGIDMIEVS